MPLIGATTFAWQPFCNASGQCTHSTPTGADRGPHSHVCTPKLLSLDYDISSNCLSGIWDKNQQAWAELCEAQVQLLPYWGWANIDGWIPDLGFTGEDLTYNCYQIYFAYFHLFKIVLGSTTVDLQMLETKFCSVPANSSYLGHLPLRTHSMEVVFQI